RAATGASTSVASLAPEAYGDAEPTAASSSALEYSVVALILGAAGERRRVVDAVSRRGVERHRTARTVEVGCVAYGPRERCTVDRQGAVARPRRSLQPIEQEAGGVEVQRGERLRRRSEERLVCLLEGEERRKRRDLREPDVPGVAGGVADDDRAVEDGWRQ